VQYTQHVREYVLFSEGTAAQFWLSLETMVSILRGACTVLHDESHNLVIFIS